MFPWAFTAAAIFWGLALVGGFYFARRHVRALERSAGNESELTELRQRVAHLEQALGETQRHVELLESPQKTTNRLPA